MKRLIAWTMTGFLALGAANLLAEEQTAAEPAAIAAPAPAETTCQPKLLQKCQRLQENRQLRRRDGSGNENRDGVPRMEQAREQRQENKRLQKRDGSCGSECIRKNR